MSMNMEMNEEEVSEENQNQNTMGFDGGIEDDVVDKILGTFGETEIWLGSDDQEEDNNISNILNDHHGSIFDNDFPPLLPDFPCMSSVSSSSSTPALTKTFVSSSASPASSANSSAASWAILRSDGEEKQQDSMVIRYDGATPAPALSSTDCFQQSDFGMEDVNCMDVMESFWCMDLIEDGDDVWDPSTIFENDDDNQTPVDYQDLNHHQIQEDGKNEGKNSVNQELAAMFFEWLKTNKEKVSMEDMRSIKLKRATIDCASKRLGNSKEGRIQLLKLILQWAEQYLHHKKRISPSVVGATAAAASSAVSATSHFPCQYQQPFPNPNSNYLVNSPNPSTCMMWIPTPQSSYVDPAAAAAASIALNPQAGFRTSAVSTVLNPQNPPGFVQPMAAYVCNDHPNYSVSGANVAPMNCRQPYPQPVQTEYQMLDNSVQFVVSPKFNSAPSNGNFSPIRQKPAARPVYNGSGEKLVKLGASATKEARRKRMARQRRSPWYIYRHQNQHRRDESVENEEQFDIENCTNDGQSNCGNWMYEGAEDCTNNNGQINGVNWVYWPAAVGVPMFDLPPTESQQMQLEWQQDDRTSPQQQTNQHQVQSERGQPKQGFKYDKNLKFLLQKVLKQSDVGNLGRIVLPKKEAETQLPLLEERDGMTIAMEDIGTNKVWNLRYRFWPNNKSRMYLLENTGEFVKANGLQEGDFIVIYSDINCGKYLIRGVKVREGLKLEAKAKAKANANAKARAARRNNKIRNSAAGNRHSHHLILNGLTKRTIPS